MPYTLAFQPLVTDVGVPLIPEQPRPGAYTSLREKDRREHFGTEALALRRALELLPGPDRLDLRLYGPDGTRLATQRELTQRLGLEAYPASLSNEEPGA